MKRGVLTNTLIALFAITATSAYAQSRPDPELNYNLPKVRVGFGVSYVLQKCPEDGAPPQIQTVTAITTKYLVGREVTLDPLAGFLTKRVLNIANYDNGVIKSFNAESEGQGGDFISAAIKAVGFGVSLATGTGVGGLALVENDDGSSQFVPTDVPERMVCRPWVSKVLQEIAQLEKSLNSPEIPVFDSKARDGRLENQLAALKRQVTLSAKSLNFVPTANSAPFDPKSGGYLYLGQVASDQVDFSRWFIARTGEAPVNVQISELGLPGTNGYTATLKGGKVDGITSGTVPTNAVCDNHALNSDRSLYYCNRFPLAASLKPNGDFSCNRDLYEDHCSQAEMIWERSKRNLGLNAPQLGGVKQIPFDGGGVFGSKAVKASFALNGTLKDAGYSDSGGSKAFAGVIDSTVSAATTVRDARVNALQREIALRQAERDLLALIEEEGNSAE